MSRSIQNEYEPDYVSLPGETLVETIEALGMSQAQLAERTGCSKKITNKIIKGKAETFSGRSSSFFSTNPIPRHSFWWKQGLLKERQQLII